MTPRAAAIVVGAGSGERLGLDRPKAFVALGGRPMLVRAAAAALACADVGLVVAVVPAGFEDLAHAMLEPLGAHAVIAGGASRDASVRAGLVAVPLETAVIVVHDAARPFATPALFGRAIAALADAEGVVPALPVPDTVKRVIGTVVQGTEPRDGLVLAQTPQAFASAALRDAHVRAEREGRGFTDDAAALEWAGYRVVTIIGEVRNAKITTIEDLARAEASAEEPAHG